MLRSDQGCLAGAGAAGFGAAGLGAGVDVIFADGLATFVTGGAVSYIVMMSRVISIVLDANRILFGWPLTSNTSVNWFSFAYFCSTCIIFWPSSFRTFCCS